MPVSRYFIPRVALLLFVAVMLGCDRSPPEQRLRESMVALQDAIEARDPAVMEEWLADDFVGPDGLDRAGARRLAQLMYLRHRNVGIRLGPMQFALQEGHATVEFAAVLTGGSNGLLPDQGQVYNVQTGWRLENDNWRLTSARWATATR